MLVFLIVALVLIALAVWGAGYLSPPLDVNIVRVIQAAIILIGVALIAQRAGMIA